MKALLLAGGVGSRLWPMSREAYPKQFIKFFDGESLFQQTVKRLAPIVGPENILVVTTSHMGFMVLSQMEEIGLEPDPEQIIKEPEPKGTLPAVLLGLNRGGKGKYGIFPSDHLIGNGSGFEQALSGAEKLADRFIVTLGVVPTGPNTGYGYIKPGKTVGPGFIVEKFVEKPDRERAEMYVRQGYLWNSGMFFFDSRIFVEEVRKASPGHVRVYEQGEKAYGEVKPQSIDWGVMEKTRRAAVVPFNGKWNDMGSFSSFYEIMNKERDGIATNTEVISLNAKNSLVLSDRNRLVAILGVENMAVIDTDDALLVTPLNRVQQVKQIVNFLKERGDERATVHTTVYKPWGYYTNLKKGGGYLIREIVIYPGKRMSLQKHYHRSEHWVVIKGTARITLGGYDGILRPGESTFVPIGQVHRVENPGRIPLKIIEVQIGEYIGEDDIERLHDDYEQ